MKCPTLISKIELPALKVHNIIKVSCIILVPEPNATPSTTLRKECKTKPNKVIIVDLFGHILLNTFTINSYYNFSSSTVKQQLYQLITTYWTTAQYQASSDCLHSTLTVPVALPDIVTYSSNNYEELKIITQLVILTLSLLLVNAHYDDRYCNNLVKNFGNKCTISSCCQLNFFSSHATSGVYKISRGSFGNAVDAYCDMTTDGGGWIVIQRNRKDSQVSFDEEWAQYEEGFGDLHTEFWYGLEEIHYLTKKGQWEMRVDYQREDNNRSYYAQYSNFSIGSASEEYPLTIEGYTGEGGDKFTSLNGMKFTTTDNDNDLYGGRNCAYKYGNGWWHKICSRNKLYINHQPPFISYSRTVTLLFTEMKIRPKDCIQQ